MNKDRLIVRQVAFKGAIDLVVAGKLELDEITSFSKKQTEEEDTKYQKFFRKALEKFGVDSPADFESEEKKKEFFDYVDKEYKADKEED